MDTDGALAPVLYGTTSFLNYFSDMLDHRQAGKVAYRLDEILLLALLATLAGAEGFTDIARFGHKKLDLLRRFVPFANGTPSHDHLGDIFAALDRAAFRRCFTAWVGGLTGAAPEVIAIDGNTLRRSGSKSGKDAIHMVSAFAGRQRLVLAQTKVSDTSNEIVAIPALLDMLAIEGAVVTIDAMGCQRDIARKIINLALSEFDRNVFLMTIAARPPGLSIRIKCWRKRNAVSPVWISKLCCTSGRSLPPKGGLARLISN